TSPPSSLAVSFLFTDTPTPHLSPLSLHDALPISHAPRPPRPSAPHAGPSRPGGAGRGARPRRGGPRGHRRRPARVGRRERAVRRSEEHTSELQSRENLVCRLLLEKKKTKHTLDKP